MHSLCPVTEEQLLICCIGNRGNKQIGTIFLPPAVQNAKQNAGCAPGYLQEWAILRRKQIYGMFLNILPNRLHFWEDTDLLTSFWRHVSPKYTMLWYFIGDTFSLLLKTDMPLHSFLYSLIYRFWKIHRQVSTAISIKQVYACKVSSVRLLVNYEEWKMLFDTDQCFVVLTWHNMLG